MFKFSECRGLCISNIGRNITDLYRPITSKEYRWRIDGGGKFRKRETVVIRSDEGLTRETSALKLLTVANSTQLKITELPCKISTLKWSKSYSLGRIFTTSPFQILQFKSHPILINSTPSKTWLERLNAGSSEENLNLRGIVMRAFAPVWGVFSKRRGLWKQISFDSRILQTFWVFQKLRCFTTFSFNQGTSHLCSNNV